VAPSPAVPSGRPIIAYLLTSQFGLKHSSSREAQEAPMSFLCEKFVVSSGCFHLAVAEDERLGRWRAPNGRVVGKYAAPVS
jgi:hypothetical protein